MTASPHLRGIVIAGALAVLALALGFVTLGMNQTASQASTHTVLPLKARQHATTAPTTARPARKVNPNLKAALDAGLPLQIARALAKKPVVVVELTSAVDPVAKLTTDEARVGATLGGAGFLEISVDRDDDVVSKFARVLGELPSAPAAIVIQRPAKPFITLTGFNDRTTVQQAAANAVAALKAQGGADGTSPVPAAAIQAGAA